MRQTAGTSQVERERDRETRETEKGDSRSSTI